MAKKEGGQLMKYDAELARLAEQQSEQEQLSGNNISFRNGQMSYRGARIPGDKLEVIVLDARIIKKWFAQAFDSDTPTSPDCFAISTNRKELGMVAHDDVTDQQHEDCDNCPLNVFGTAERGKGKACRDIRKLAVITADEAETVAGIEKAVIATAEISVTNVKHWKGYANRINTTVKKPTLGVVTLMSCEPDKDTQVKVSFELVRPITDKKVFGALLAKYEEAQKVLDTPYPKNTGTDAPKSSKKAKPKLKAVAAKPKAAAAKPKPAAPAPVKAKPKLAVVAAKPKKEPAAAAESGDKPLKKVKF